MQLLVLGMHRSGTSAVTRLLNMAGAWFGPEGIATEANEENPKGFWERRDLRAIDDALLHGAGADWWKLAAFDAEQIPQAVLDEQLPALRNLVVDLDAHRPWVLKEPRLCVLLPVLRPLLEVPVAIHVVRDPIEIARSLAARNGFAINAGIALWELYTVHALRGSAGMPRVVVRYDELLADPAATTDRMLEELAAVGVDGLRRPRPAEIEAFVSRDLHRQHSERRERAGWLNPQQQQLLDDLVNGVEPEDAAALTVSPVALDALRSLERIVEAEESLADTAERVESLDRQLAEVQERAEREEARAREQTGRANRLEAALARTQELREEERAAHEASLAEATAGAAAELQAAQGELAVAVADADTTRVDLEAARAALVAAELRHDEAQREAAEAAEEQLAALERRAADAERRRADLARRVDQAYERLRRTEDGLRRFSASTSWRTTWRLVRLQSRLRGGTPGNGPLRAGIDGVRAARNTLKPPDEPKASGADKPPAGPSAAPAPATTPAPAAAAPPAATRSLPSPAARTSDRPKVAVLAWDVGHNPLGRAYIMAELLARHFEVEIWGAQFERYGSDVWAPLRDAPVPIHSFPGLPFPDHLEVMEQVAGRIDADLLWVAKPRFPSLGLGALAKAARNRPLVVDVDDHELAFFAEDEGLGLDELERYRSDPNLLLPFERPWTRACDPVIGEADAVTVSNPELQRRYGGRIVPHARDETVFDPSRFDRAAIRAELGFTDEHRLLLFGGTPRVHKGAVEVLRALDALGDDRYRLLLFGTRELHELGPEYASLERWVAPLPYTAFHELPRWVVAADLSCVLQDPTHPVARYQMPAKISDALALEVPLLLRPLPPMQDLVDAGVVAVHDDAVTLPERIAGLFDDRDALRELAVRAREHFLERYSYAAVGAETAAWFGELLADEPAPLSPALRELVAAPRAVVPGAAPTPADTAEPLAPIAAPGGRVPGRRRRPLRAEETYDIVMFWKQNDSGIYGRRQDMFLEYLRREPRVGRIIHFDNPITPEDLYKTYRAGRGNASDQSTLVVRQTVERLLRRRDEPGVTRRTFVYAGTRSKKLKLPKRAGYIDYVREVLRQEKVGARPTVFWAFPTNADFPVLADALDPDVVVVDVVDDNRSWYEPGTAGWDRVERNYAEVLARADVVLANCDPVAEAMRTWAPDVHVIPNGLELPDGTPAGARPRELAGLTGPVIGYVGNLSSRIDIPLLDALATERPDWNFVFIGSAHTDRSILALEAHPSVRFLGVKPYAEVRRILPHFDVALIPHVDNEMTRSMNPLKAFVYCAAGVPVVSTPVANLDQLAELIIQAEGVDGFLDAIEDVLEAERTPPRLDILTPHSWSERVRVALDLVDEAFGGRAPAREPRPRRSRRSVDTSSGTPSTNGTNGSNGTANGTVNGSANGTTAAPAASPAPD